MALQAGQTFGNYRIVRLIGAGGFGDVYLAENPLIERRAAVKVLHPALAQDKESVRRFLNEARAASAIHHPSIIEVFDAGGVAEGIPYILMEFLEGISLKKRLEDVGRLAPAQVLELARQAGSALAAAHAAGIVHRDLKPENLFLIRDPSVPGGERVKILDFGIAKIMRGGGGAGSTNRTETGLIMGSPAYMSPEQCVDSADVDLRTDIYSFAIILYEMLTGRTPYVSASGTQLLLMHMSETPPPLSGLVGDVAGHVEAAILRALARAREDRFDGFSSFIGALRGDGSECTPVLKRRSPLAKSHTGGASSTPGRSVARSSVTTFSWAPGGLGSEVRGGPSAETKPARRWRFLAFGGVAVAGVVLLLLVRPGHEPMVPTAVLGASVAAPASVFVRGEAQKNAASGSLPRAADGGVTPVAWVETTPAAPTPKPGLIVAGSGPSTSRPAKARRPNPTSQHAALAPNRPPLAPPPSPPQKQEDVTGF